MEQKILSQDTKSTSSTEGQKATTTATTTNQTQEATDALKCPRCGSTQIHVDKRGFDAGSACCGAIILGPLGLLCGADGANKLRKTCLNCKKTW